MQVIQKIVIALLVGASLCTGGAIALESTPAATTSVAEPTTITINIPARSLYLYKGDNLLKQYPVGVGRPTFPTKIGQFKVIRKIKNPVWENPYLAKNAMVIKAGTSNPLGTRWIGFYNDGNGEFGIHGTPSPASVGQYSSHGCIRMRIKDAEEVFEKVQTDASVKVVYEPVEIRKANNNIQVIAHADRYRKGYPTIQAIQQKIMNQYPNVKINAGALKMALQQRAGKPVMVGQLVSAEQVGQTNQTGQTN